jgi:hypothetical protein
VRVVPVVVADVHVENAAVELCSQRCDHLFLAHFTVDALVGDVKFDEPCANLDHHGYVLEFGSYIVSYEQNNKYIMVVWCVINSY